MGKKRNTRRRNTRRRKQRQQGSGYTFGSAISPEAPYAQEVIGGPRLTPDCFAATRPGLVSSTITGSGGLPGFAGGMRQNLGSESIQKALGAPLMNGGRYTVDVGQGPLTSSAGPGMGGYPIINRIGCEGGIVTSTPPGITANPTPFLTGQNGGVGGVDSASYIAPTAGYTNTPSTWVSSSGSPSLLQTPYDARSMNPACIKTGGRRSRRKHRKSRRSLKNRR